MGENPEELPDLDESADALVSDALDTLRKVELIKKLLKHRKDPRVADILHRQLRIQKDPEVLKTIILGFGYIKNPKFVPDLVPFINHSSFRVIAATIKAICKIDSGGELDLASTLLVSKDDRARTASILALLSHDQALGLEAIGQLGASRSVVLRRTAVQCLKAADPGATEHICQDMFFAETEPDLLDSLHDLMRRGPTRPGLERLYSYKARMKAHPDETLAGALVQERRQRYVEQLIEHVTDVLNVSSDGVGTLEGRLEVEIAQQKVERSRQDQENRDHVQEKREAARKARTSGEPTSRVALLLILCLAVFGGMISFILQNVEAQRPRTLEVATTQMETSSMGQVGDAVAFEGKVLRIFKSLNTATIQGPDGVMAVGTFPGGLPRAAFAEEGVYLEGRISSIKSARSIYIEVSSLKSAHAF